MAEPSRRTGFLITGVGLFVTVLAEVLRLLLEASAIDASLTTVRVLYDLSILLASDVGPGITAWGVGWLLASFKSFRRTYLYVVVGGISLMTTMFTLMRWDIMDAPFLDFRGILLLSSLFYAVGPMLLAAGVAAGVLIERRRLRNGGPAVQPTHDVALAAVLVGSLFLPYLAVLTPNWRLLLWAIVTWIVWHVAAPWLANGVILGFRPSTREATRAAYQLEVGVGPPRPHLTFTRILAKAYVPTAFGLGATFTVYRFSKFTPWHIPFTPGPFGIVADMTSYAIWAIVLGSLYVGPVVWLLQDAGIRLTAIMDGVIKMPRVHSFFLSMTKTYGFVVGPFLFVFLTTERDYLLTATLLPLMLYTIFTVSVAATLLYLVLSHTRCLKRLHATFDTVNR